VRATPRHAPARAPAQPDRNGRVVLAFRRCHLGVPLSDSVSVGAPRMSPVSSMKSLVATWLGLLLLLAATTASAYVPLGVGNTLLNIAIAAIQIGLIAVAFMHLNRSETVVR